jgi:leader peptidase (prepilin peptidase)/N-methyltransferase
MFLSVWFKVNSLNLSADLLLPVLIADFLLVIFIVLTIFIDLDHLIIPNKITYPVILFGLALSVYAPNLWPLAYGSRWKGFALSCASVTVAAGTLAIFAFAGKKIFKKDALGWGDVKYIAAVAAVLGPWAAFFTLFLGSFLGSVIGIVLIIQKRKGLRSGIPFGPPLAVSTFIWILCGSELLQAYLRFTAELAKKYSI